MYSKSIREVVTVYGKNKQISNSNKPDSNVKTKSEVDELDLTGSPLKQDLSLHAILDDGRKRKASQMPIEVETARDIANLFNKHRDELSSEEAIPLWILLNPSPNNKPLLLTSQSDEEHFARGIVTYEGTTTVDDVDLDQYIADYAKMEGLTDDLINTAIDCKYLISGILYGSHNTDELLNAPHGGITELHCEWTGKMLQEDVANTLYKLLS